MRLFTIYIAGRNLTDLQRSESFPDRFAWSI